MLLCKEVLTCCQYKFTEVYASVQCNLALLITIGQTTSEHGQFAYTHRKVIYQLYDMT